VPDRREALDALTAITEELGLYDDAPTVCITHLRFFPCRHESADSPCALSTTAADVEAVRIYQQGAQ
jgi:hypothetical protein